MWKDQYTDPANEKTQREIYDGCECHVDSLVCPGCDGNSVKANFKKYFEDNLQNKLNEELEEDLEKQLHKWTTLL